MPLDVCGFVPDSDVIDQISKVLIALLTPVIAVAGWWISRRQWLTNRDKLKHDLFDKRFSVYSVVRNFVDTVAIVDRANSAHERSQMLEAAYKARWLFNEELEQYLRLILDNDSELRSLIGVDHGTRIIARSEDYKVRAGKIRDWFKAESQTLPKHFATYLELRH